ncbi:Lon protease family protein [Hafnia alvei]|nr:Lon protease family protein [Hafnia alvei]
MILKAEETYEYLAILHRATGELLPELTLRGSQYHIDGMHVSIMPADNPQANFAATATSLFADWYEGEQLFGTVRQSNGKITLEPGMVHKANGGVLILSLRTMLAQPLLWLRLKQIVLGRKFKWFSPDDNKPLPVHIPDMPIDLKVILVSDREGLADFQDMEPDLCFNSIYGEFEADMSLVDTEDMQRWCSLVTTIANEYQLPPIAEDAWPILVHTAIRAIGDQGTLPLSPTLIARTLREAALHSNEVIDAQALNETLASRRWREGYLAERMHDEIELGQILIETEGEVVGQINGLSVLEYPGHPLMFGEPSRITCAVHLGDGEFTDVERKAELGGNLHAKGMMIMQAFLISELDLEQQLPFSASIVFEQSYGEVDGDSASLAELCALVSALSLAPINQQIAVTGSVDQFGHVQPIGGVNEKIEGFFEACQRRGLTGSQGVIIPATNARHLCLSTEVIDAVKAGTFHLWAVENAEDALPILTGVVYRSETGPSLIGAIQDRIAAISPMDKRQLPWPLRWLNWFNHG